MTKIDELPFLEVLKEFDSLCGLLARSFDLDDAATRATIARSATRNVCGRRHATPTDEHLDALVDALLVAR